MLPGSLFISGSTFLIGNVVTKQLGYTFLNSQCIDIGKVDIEIRRIWMICTLFVEGSECTEYGAGNSESHIYRRRRDACLLAPISHGTPNYDPSSSCCLSDSLKCSPLEPKQVHCRLAWLPPTPGGLLKINGKLWRIRTQDQIKAADPSCRRLMPRANT
jgi:hypothetical protein